MSVGGYELSHQIITITAICIFFVILAFLSAVLTKLVLNYALARRVYDIPNERSSHKVPTPRGGGVAIVIISLVLTVLLAFFLPQSSQLLLGAIALGGGLVAFIGALDDFRGVRPSMRLLVHFCAAIIAVYAFSAISATSAPWNILPQNMFMVLSLFFLVWMTNLFNFMDGIDGIAGVETISFSLVIGIIAFSRGNVVLSLFCLGLAGATSGFLRWNWHPAKIFMGDVSSGFLGFTLGVIALWGESSGSIPLTASLILLACFIGDSTWTLIRRGLAGKRVYQAHCDHTYQHAVKEGFSHTQVSSAVLLINGLWLTPLAILLLQQGYSIYLLVAAYIPILFLAKKFKAGRELITN